MSNPILFTTTSYRYFSPLIAALYSIEHGEVDRKTFPDGEFYTRIQSDVENADIILIGGTISDVDTLELYDLANGLIQMGVHSLKIVIPYFGYATMERAVKTGEVVKAKNRALLFSSLPKASVGHEIFLLDLHAEGIPYYFEKDIRCHHIYCKALIISACRELCSATFVLASTDAGRAKWVESLANDMHVRSAFVYKQRLSGESTQITGVNADVKGQNVIIYDDMIRTGGSLMQAASAYADAGAARVFAICTHGLFTNDALEKIRQQGIIQQVICMNTHPNSILFESEYLVVKSVAPLIFDAIK